MAPGILGDDIFPRKKLDPPRIRGSHMLALSLKNRAELHALEGKDLLCTLDNIFHHQATEDVEDPERSHIHQIRRETPEVALQVHSAHPESKNVRKLSIFFFL